MADLFLSYSSKDRSSASLLADHLREQGYSVWMDQRSIAGAMNWTAEIVEAINACSTMVLLLSPNSVRSENVAKEIHLASEKRKNILPVILERTALPPIFEFPLAGIQHVHYTDTPSIVNALDLLHKRVYVGEEIKATPALRAKKDNAVRLAVLPFDDLSPQHDNQWFADGMMDELIGTLGTLDRVKVPSRTDVLHYREHQQKSREIARDLDVRYLIEGAVRKAGDKIRINVTLTDAAKNEQLWANKFDGNFDNVFEFQEDVSRNIAEALRLQLTPKDEEKIAEAPTQNAEAYELYLRGREQQYLATKEGYEKALALYENALKLDPNFVLVYVAIASACNMYYREYSREIDWLKKSEAELKKAETLTDTTGNILCLRGEIEWLKGNYDDAIRILTEAIELNPNDQKIFNSLGILYSILGQFENAVNAFERAVDIEESTIGFFNLLIALNAVNNRTRLKQTAIRAIPIFDRYIATHKDDLYATVNKAFVLNWAGRSEEATNLANILLSSNLSGIALYNLGCLFDDFGKPALYVELLKKAIKKGYREIEQTRNYVFTTKDPECEKEFRIVIAELETIIKEESNGSHKLLKL